MAATYPRTHWKLSFERFSGPRPTKALGARSTAQPGVPHVILLVALVGATRTGYQSSEIAASDDMLRTKALIDKFFS